MPDLNKLAALEANSYQIIASCNLCQYANLTNSDWGTCSLISYQHLKHNGTRQASIHKSGYCPKFKINQAKADDLITSGFDKFLKEKQ